MNKEQFRTLIINPLEKKFNVRIYFKNDKEACLKKLYLPLGAYGIAYIYQSQKALVIKWMPNIHDTISALFHELGHLFLHGKGSNFKGREGICELEAELAAYFMCKVLNIYYEHYFWDKTCKISNFEMLLRNKPAGSNPRYELIMNGVREVAKILKPIVKNSKFNQFTELDKVKNFIYK